MNTILVIYLLLALSAYVAARIALILRQRRAPARPRKSCRTMVVLGSGGHTAEMLALLRKMDKDAYAKRTYVVAATDRLSATKAISQEQEWCRSGASSMGSYEAVKLEVRLCSVGCIGRRQFAMIFGVVIIKLVTSNA